MLSQNAYKTPVKAKLLWQFPSILLLLAF